MRRKKCLRGGVIQSKSYPALDVYNSEEMLTSAKVCETCVGG